MCLLLSERSLCLGLILQEVWSHRRLPDGSVFSSQLVEGREELLSLLVIPALEFRDPAAGVPFHQLMRPLGAVWLLQTIKHFKDKAKVGWGGVQPQEKLVNTKKNHATKITEEMRMPSAGAQEMFPPPCCLGSKR